VTDFETTPPQGPFGMLPSPSADLAAYFLAEGEQTVHAVAARLADFIGGARQSLEIAVYDFRLSDPLKAIVAEALAERARAGVAIRVAYHADKPQPPMLSVGMDPAPPGTGAFVQSLGYPFRRISGVKLMHNKYLVRDADLLSAAVWTGSTNLTDDSWTLQENNTLVLRSPQLAGYYARDFADLWRAEQIENTGDFDTAPATLRYRGAAAAVHVLFSPGRGPEIDFDVAQRVMHARRRVRICSMLLNSGALLDALGGLLRAGRVRVDGVYDRTQMVSVFEQLQDVPHNRWKIAAAQDIIQDAGLVGKISTPYSPTSRHDFMHNKVLLVDDTIITGSYNFSHSAEQNAENILMIESPALAAAYSDYIDHLIAKYGGGPM